jgi:hypothetical protein
MKVAIIGSRNYGNMRAVREYINRLPKTTTIITGGGEGVGVFAEKVARERGMPTMIVSGNWKQRNLKMVEESDRVVAFWDGFSVMTKQMIEACRVAGRTLDVRGDTLSYERCPAGYTRGSIIGGKRVPVPVKFQ